MAASLRYIGFSCMVFLAFQQMATGINCYSCVSCSTVSSSTTTTGATTDTSCYKLVYTLSGITTVVRGSTTGCTAGSTTYGGNSATNYCCSSDLCNGGVALSGSLVFALAIAALGSVLRAVSTN